MAESKGEDAATLHPVVHTPGPWTAKRLLDNTGKPYATLYEAHIDLDVCMVWAPTGNAEQEANARLIAAAPDLLMMCKLAFERMDNSCLRTYADLIFKEMLRKEIEKATGLVV